MVREVARRIFGTEIIMRVAERRQENIGENVTTEHVIFKIEEVIRDGCVSTHSLAKSTESLRSDVYHGDLNLTLKDFCDIFPHHICFTKDLTIEHYGVNIKRCYPFVMRGETHFDDLLEIIHPEVAMTYDNFLSFINSAFVFKMKDIGVRDPNKPDRIISVKGKQYAEE